MDSLGVTLTLIIYDSSLLAADTNNGERERERERSECVWKAFSTLRSFPLDLPPINTSML